MDIFPNNLPLQLTSFIGRKREIEEVTALLISGDNSDYYHRLVTLSGTGGTGKTRLSLQVAAELFEHYPDGVWFLELAALTDGAQVPQALVSTLKLGEPRNITLLELLTSYLRARKVLILVDNCEHLLDAVRKGEPHAREAMLTASHLSGKAIDISKTTASHALSYSLTSTFGVPHGDAVALTLGAMVSCQ